MMLKTITLIGMICCLTIEMNAQDVKSTSKSSCQPSSCGPEGTKVEEAAIISHLRTEVVALHQAARSVSDQLSLELGALEAEKLSGSDDGESVRLMAQFLSGLHQEVIEHIPSAKLNPQVEQLNFEVTESAARVVSKLVQNVLILQEQLKQL